MSFVSCVGLVLYLNSVLPTNQFISSLYYKELINWFVGNATVQTSTTRIYKDVAQGGGKIEARHWP